MIQRLTSAMVLSFALIACGDPIEPRQSKVVEITVNGPDTLYTGVTVKFTPRFTFAGDSSGTAPVVQWTSTNTAYVTVDGAGRVNAVQSTLKTDGTGTHVAVAITARVGDVVGSRDVKVLSANASAIPVIYPAPAVLMVGDTKKLAAYNGLPSNGAVFATGWASDHPEIAAVDASGIVSGVKPGQATITAISAVSGQVATIASIVTVVANPQLKFTAVSGGFFSEGIIGAGSISRYDRNCGLNASGAMYCWQILAPGTTPYEQRYLTWLHGRYQEIRWSDLPVRLPDTPTFASLSVGDGGGGCGLAVAGDIYCFGLNDSGQLGLPIGPGDALGFGHFLDHPWARLPSPEGFRAVFAGSDQRCAIARNGLAYCWGRTFGPAVTRVSTFAWNTIAERGSCGITADSAAYCWRGTANGVTINAAPVSYHWTHIDVSDIDRSVTRAWACALASSGELACWSFSATGDPQSPVLLPNTPKLVSLGSTPTSHPFDQTQTCGLTAGGDMYCVAVTETTSNPTYALQPLDLGVKLKSFSGNCGIGLDDKAYCWRWNSLKAVLVPGQQP
jgi:hypothetical protein